MNAETDRATLYTHQYLEGLKLGANLPPTELQPADDLAILAGNVFVSLWRISGDQKYLYNAVGLLEFALTKSKQSFQTRLMLIRIYRLLGKTSLRLFDHLLRFRFTGASSMALEHYRVMQIKQVQYDTLSHFILSRASTFSLASSGDLTLATECLEASQIYISNTQDVCPSLAPWVELTCLQTGEYIARAFTGEKYSQVKHLHHSYIFNPQLCADP